MIFNKTKYLKNFNTHIVELAQKEIFLFNLFNWKSHPLID